jgi:hypothetical protein
MIKNTFPEQNRIWGHVTILPIRADETSPFLYQENML